MTEYQILMVVISLFVTMIGMIVKLFLIIIEKNAKKLPLFLRKVWVVKTQKSKA